MIHNIFQTNPQRLKPIIDGPNPRPIQFQNFISRLLHLPLLKSICQAPHKSQHTTKFPNLTHSQMAPPFIFSPNLELEYEDNRLSVQTLTSLSSFTPSSLEEFVKGVSFDLSDKELFCVEDQDLFDRVYSLVKSFSTLSPSCKFNLVESLRSNFSVLLPNVDSLSRASQSQNDDQTPVVDRIASHRNAFKIYTFFLLQVVLEEESNVSSNHSTKVNYFISTLFIYSIRFNF